MFHRYSTLPAQKSRIIPTFLMLAPPFPMMFLWNCLKIGTGMEKLFSIWPKRRQSNKINTGGKWGRQPMVSCPFTSCSREQLPCPRGGQQSQLEYQIWGTICYQLCPPKSFLSVCPAGSRYGSWLRNRCVPSLEEEKYERGKKNKIYKCCRESFFFACLLPLELEAT